MLFAVKSALTTADVHGAKGETDSMKISKLKSGKSEVEKVREEMVEMIEKVQDKLTESIRKEISSLDSRFTNEVKKLKDAMAAMAANDEGGDMNLRMDDNLALQVNLDKRGGRGGFSIPNTLFTAFLVLGFRFARDWLNGRFVRLDHPE